MSVHSSVFCYHCALTAISSSSSGLNALFPLGFASQASGHTITTLINGSEKNTVATVTAKNSFSPLHVFQVKQQTWYYFQLRSSPKRCPGTENQPGDKNIHNVVKNRFSIDVLIKAGYEISND